MTGDNFDWVESSFDKKLAERAQEAAQGVGKRSAAQQLRVLFRRLKRASRAFLREWRV